MFDYSNSRGRLWFYTWIRRLSTLSIGTPALSDEWQITSLTVVRRKPISALSLPLILLTGDVLIIDSCVSVASRRFIRQATGRRRICPRAWVSREMQYFYDGGCLGLSLVVYCIARWRGMHLFAICAAGRMTYYLITCYATNAISALSGSLM